MLHIKDLDERNSVENAAVLALAKKKTGHRAAKRRIC